MPKNLLKLSNIPKFDHNYSNVVVEEYTLIPDRFTSLKDWPKRCNHTCYTCTNPIIYPPLFVPAAIDGEGIDRMGKMLFCSPSCEFRHISGFQHNRELYMRYARELIRRFTGIPIARQTCELSDDRSVLSEYGGDKSRREYRDSIVIKNKEYYDALFAQIELGR
jgi:hypothetical protein